MQKRAGLTAETLQDSITAAIAPHMQPRDRRALTADLRALRRCTLGGGSYAPQPMPKEEINPEKAAAWFAAMGANVIRTGQPEQPPAGETA